MTRKYNPGEKVWVKGKVCESFRPPEDGYYVEIVDVAGEEAWMPMVAEDIRPRVKREGPVSPWLPFGEAPRLPWVPLLFRWGQLDMMTVGYWCDWERAWQFDQTDISDGDPTHYMLIPPLP